MNTKALNSLADLICRAQVNGKRTPMGIAMAIDSAQRHMTPETAAELAAFRALDLGTAEGRISAKCEDPKHPVWLRDLDDVRGCPWCRVAELEQQLAAKDRPADEDPIAFALTAKAEEVCDHPNGYGPYGCAGCGVFPPADGEDDVSPKVRKLRDLLAGQRAAVLEDPHDSPLHHNYRVPRDLPEVQG